VNAPLPALVAVEAVPALPAADFELAKDFARAEKAAATRKAYRSDFDLFCTWCEGRRVSALPAAPETVAAFLAAEAARGIKASSIGRRVAAIRYAHKLAGHTDPPTNSEAVKATVRGIRRTIGAGKVRKTPATAEKVIAMVTTSRSDMKGLRDRALLLLGFAGAFRRSELVALDCEDLEQTAEGLRITIRHSKTDQEGQGAVIAILRGAIACRVAAVKAWRDAAGIETGPLFRPVSKGGKIESARLSDRAVANGAKPTGATLNCSAPGARGAAFRRSPPLLRRLRPSWRPRRRVASRRRASAVAWQRFATLTSLAAILTRRRTPKR
jgi:site-specific recombinase XerC